MDINVLKKQLGLRLKEVRLAKGMKQEDLEKWSFSYRYYGRMERGLVNPTLETLARLCDIFEISMSDLFAFTDTDREASEDREAVALKVAQVLKGRSKKRIRKLRVFLDEVL